MPSVKSFGIFVLFDERKNKKSWDIRDKFSCYCSY